MAYTIEIVRLNTKPRALREVFLFVVFCKLVNLFVQSFTLPGLFIVLKSRAWSVHVIYAHARAGLAVVAIGAPAFLIRTLNTSRGLIRRMSVYHLTD